MQKINQEAELALKERELNIKRQNQQLEKDLYQYLITLIAVVLAVATACIYVAVKDFWMGIALFLMICIGCYFANIVLYGFYWNSRLNEYEDVVETDRTREVSINQLTLEQKKVARDGLAKTLEQLNAEIEKEEKI